MIEIDKGEGELLYGGVFVNVFEGVRNLETDEVSINESLEFRRNVSSGARLYIEVSDPCSNQGGCGIGPYSVTLRTGPVG